MQSFVWFVSACRIWTGAILWALENEPEQIMVCCTGWKKDREDLSSSEEPEKTRLQVTLCNQRQRQGPPLPDSPTIYTFTCLSEPHKHPSPHFLSPHPISSANTVSWQSHYYLFRKIDIWSRALARFLLSAWGKQKLPKTVNALPALIRLLWTQWGSVGEWSR